MDGCVTSFFSCTSRSFHLFCLLSYNKSKQPLTFFFLLKLAGTGGVIVTGFMLRDLLFADLRQIFL